MNTKLIKFVRRTIKNLVRPIMAYEMNRLKEERDATTGYISKLHATTGETDNNLNCQAVVFSKNRAMQLHALLSSYFEYVTHPVPLHILFTCSPEHEASYTELQQIFSAHPVTFHRETIFKPQLEDLLRELPVTKVFFMTDDAIIVHRFDMHDFLRFNPLNIIPALTKGLDNTYCFTKNCEQTLPPFLQEFDGKRIWNWAEAIHAPEWNYPLSLDGTLYNKAEIMHYIERTPYKAPNSLEGNLQIYKSAFEQRKGLCYEKTIYINIPCNLTQTECLNRSTGQYDVATLLRKWSEGYRIRYEALYDADLRVAQQAQFEFIKRN